MNCRKYEQHIAAYLAGELSPDLTRRVEAHLDTCCDCRASVTAQQTISAALKQESPAKAPADLASRIMASIPKAAPAAAVPEKESPFSCREFEINLAAYVEGGIDPGFHRLMTSHRATCSACDRAADAHITVAAALTSAERIETPAGLEASILARIAEAYALSPAKRWEMIAAMATAIGSFAAVAAILIRPLSNIVIAATGKLNRFEETLSDTTAYDTVSALSATAIQRMGEYIGQVLTSNVALPYVSTTVPAYFIVAALLAVSTTVWYLNDSEAVFSEVY